MLQREQSAIHLTFIKLPFVIKTFVLTVFEWPLKTGFTVTLFIYNITLFFFCRVQQSNAKVGFPLSTLSMLGNFS